MVWPRMAGQGRESRMSELDRGPDVVSDVHLESGVSSEGTDAASADSDSLDTEDAEVEP